MAAGHLHGITLNRNEIAAFERDKLHRETERTFGKHIRQETQYDPMGRLIAAVTPDFSETFAFDPAGNRLDLSGNKQDQTGRTNSQEKPSLNKVWGNLLKRVCRRTLRLRPTRQPDPQNPQWRNHRLPVERLQPTH